MFQLHAERVDVNHRAILCAIFFANVALAGPGFETPVDSATQNRFIPKENRIYVHSFGKAQSLGLTSYERLSLTKGMDLDQAVKQVLSDYSFNSMIAVRREPTRSGDDGTSRHYRFFIRDVPICKFEVSAYETPGGAPVILGAVPRFNSNFDIPSLENWPRRESVLMHIESELNRDSQKSVAVEESEPCWIVRNENLIPSWNLMVSRDGLTYSVIANEDETFDTQKRFFDVAGTARVYDKNPSDGDLKDFTLKDLKGDKTLTSTVFTTKPTGEDRATSSSYTFNYDNDDPRFDEASVFAHATRQYEWFTSKGFKNYTDSRITLRMHYVFSDNNINNALYVAETKSSAPSINIADGDGYILQNLAKDSDVVAHELGHHIIFKNIKETTGESLVLHEGLADYFTFDQSGNSCLGESICPAGSPIGCEETNCLRSGSTDYKYTDSDLPTESHFKSQFISGMLWDIRQSGKIPKSHWTKIVLKSLSYMQKDSGYHDFILSLLVADKSLYDREYGCYIYKAAVDRGLSELIDDFTCKGKLEPPKPNPATSTGSSSSSSGSTKSGPCSVVGGLSNGTQVHNIGAWFAWIIFGILLVRDFYLSRRIRRDGSSPV